MTPDEVEALFQSVPGDDGRRTEALEPVARTARELREAQSPELDLLAEKIGNGSRQEPWRVALGESGLLDFFLSLVGADESRPSLLTHALRIIGNSCADKDENRRRVVESGRLPGIVALLKEDTSLLPFAIPVLYNICVDYEPAQIAAYKAGVNPSLVGLLVSPRLEKVSASLGIIYKLLSLVAGQEPEADLVHPATPAIILDLVTNPTVPIELEDFLGLSSVALAYLSHEQFQENFLATPGAVGLFFQAFSKTCEDSDAPRTNGDGDGDEDRAQLVELLSAFTKTLADLSANPRFVSLCPLDGPEAETLRRWILSPHAPLQSAACLALGNIARSDTTSVALVRDLSTHKSLIAILSSDPAAVDVQVLHSALSFLKNLSIPADNKALIGDAGLFAPDVLPRVWDLETQPQIQFDAVSLARLLLVGCAANARRILAAEAPSPSPTGTRTLLHRLLELHRKADQEPIKMETARAAANICRLLHSGGAVGPALLADPSSPPAPDEAQALLSGFYARYPALPDALLSLGLQAKFPVLRSELWFVLALMVRSAEGGAAAAAVARALQRHPEVVRLLAETVTGEKPPAAAAEEAEAAGHPAAAPGPGPAPDLSAAIGGLGPLEPQQADPARAAAMAKVDRENGLVLVAELLKRCPDELSPASRDTLSRILAAGGSLVLGDRDNGKDKE
ncbi:ARM repeat-containing protein [Durotheca rogersii]|uniref:ARM repeat-containing protein n=1 Tax=Durotheca rogersii TaxID=419775 RepID=UPI0022203B73|nr:ARM repeat-containing protein [Durotheca rogersii]KAI5856677.1 ARM repeat-containing protein [Durotheca rogersii]